MKFRTILMAAAFVVAPALVPGAAQAQPVTGPYVSLGAGINSAYPINDRWAAMGYYDKFFTRPSFAGVAGLGYGFGNGFRIELSGNYDRNTFHKTFYYNSYWYGAKGGLNTYGLMVNGYYDIDAGWPVFPYVGAGAGYEWVKLNPNLLQYASCCGSEYAVSGTRGSLAFDLIAGVSYPLPWVPGLSATAEYRFMMLTASRNYPARYNGSSYGSDKIGQQSSNSFLLGLRYQLFAPPPPAPKPAPVAAPTPVAAPAPAPARTFLVFFDWDKANLTPRAMQIVSEAAHASITTAVTRLNVNGYTDTSGAAGYNMKLSLRRANNVAAELVADGVAKDEIVIKGFGETHLLVPTGPNVREPQNRRVEIILH